MLIKCHLFERKNDKGSVFKAKRRSGSGNNYSSSSLTRGKGPEDLSFTLGPQTQ